MSEASTLSDEVGPGSEAARQRVSMARLDVLKTLGDNTRYAIYLELARSPRPLSTADISDSLGLHANTVRPHLERMREVGLVTVVAVASGMVGRPQHHYELSADAPALGLEPSPWPTLARMLLHAAASGGLDGTDMIEAGTEQGRSDATHWDDTTDCVDALLVEQSRLGFDPEVVDDDEGTVMAFAHCPFAELAQTAPDLVCRLHCGMVRGFVDAFDDSTEVSDFHDLADRAPCRVDLVRA